MFVVSSNDAADYLIFETPKGLPSDVLLYYTQCGEDIQSNQFILQIDESQNAIDNARYAMDIVAR